MKTHGFSSETDLQNAGIFHIFFLLYQWVNQNWSEVAPVPRTGDFNSTKKRCKFNQIQLIQSMGKKYQLNG